MVRLADCHRFDVRTEYTCTSARVVLDDFTRYIYVVLEYGMEYDSYRCSSNTVYVPVDCDCTLYVHV